MNQDERDYLTPSDYENPNWDDWRPQCHNWRKYVSDEVRSIWETLTKEQKLFIARNYQEMANYEEWD